MVRHRDKNAGERAVGGWAREKFAFFYITMIMPS